MPSRSPLIMIGCGDERMSWCGRDSARRPRCRLRRAAPRLRLDAALVGEQDVHAGIEEGELAQAMLERREVEFGLGEGLGRGQEGHLACRACHRRRRRPSAARPASPSVKRMACSLPSRQMRRLSHVGERIDDRDADAMQAARHLVGVLVEFSAGMELGHDHFGGRDAFAFVDVGRDAAAVVASRCRSRRH